MRGNMKDMGNVGEGGICPTGQHIFEITEIAPKTSKNNDPMIGITCQIAQGVNKGKIIWDNIILSDNPDSPGWKIRWRAKVFLKAIGEEHKGDSFAWDSDNWMCKKFLGTVAHEIQKEGKNKGKPKAIITGFLPLDEETPDESVPF